MSYVRFHLSLLLIFTFAFALADAGSTGTIIGSVVSTTNVPIAGAAVLAKSGSAILRAVTDARGTFTITNVPVDTYTISVSAKGYEPYSVAGLNVFADEDERVSVVLSKGLRTIAAVHARSSTSAFQPQQTTDQYTLNTAGIEQFLGKSFNTDQTKLLRSLPSVTIDRSGTPLIRGGFSYQTAFEFEGIDYTEPNASLLNRFQNTGNGGLLNGVGAIEIIPGGGDATHGNTGTGLVSLTAKRGTFPATGTFDAEMGSFGARQIGAEYGIAGSHISNYLSFISEYQPDQYGSNNTDPRSIGASPLTQDPNANSNVNAHFGSPYTTAFFNTASTTSRDFIDNFVYKFGRNDHDSLQFFLQSQSISQVLNYGGIAKLDVVDPSEYLFGPQAFGCDPIFQNCSNQTLLGREVATLFPAARPGAPVDAPGTAQNPFLAYKVEFSDALNANTSWSTRMYHTYDSQSLVEPDQGLYYTSSGGERTGISSDVTKLLTEKHAVRLGGKFEFAKPFGTRDDYVDYESAYAGGAAVGLYNQIQLRTADVLPDFISPQDYFIDPNQLAPTTGTPGCANAQPVAGSAASYASNPVNCGFLASRFPTGKIPHLPVESEIPTAQQQMYAVYLQDTYSPNARIHALVGLRLDGYNFLLPDDPTAPPSVDGIRHQREYEPHIGLSYLLTRHDVVRVNFGRTLAIPLASFLGDSIDRAAFNAFNDIPSYDNRRGAFDPNRPLATQATYCGVGSAPTSTLFTSNVVLGTQPCASYADQLYWLVRNYRFGLQQQQTYPLRGSTFTNYDVSYSHEFRDGTSFKITPFYRRGYDIVEHTRSLLGYDIVTEIPELTPDLVSNLGQQTARGVEFFLTRPRDLGLSYQLSATYVNQFGNDPPGAYLPTASLQLGLQYHSPYLAPFQSTLGLTYKSRSGWSFNPVFAYHSGYPYGQGVYSAFTVNGKAVFAPLTDAIIGGTNGALVSPALVDPQNPGTILNPNIAAYRGTEAANSGPGTLRSSPSLITDLTVKYTPPGAAVTWGLTIDNLFNEIADIPVPNYAQMIIPYATGRSYVVPGKLGNPKDPSVIAPTAIGSTTQPYIIFPNQTPLSYRLFLQVKL